MGDLEAVAEYALRADSLSAKTVSTLLKAFECGSMTMCTSASLSFAWNVSLST